MGGSKDPSAVLEYDIRGQGTGMKAAEGVAGSGAHSVRK